MRIHQKPLLVALSVLLGAGLALGQNAGNKSAGPTQNTFRLRVVEPVEGGTVGHDRPSDGLQRSSSAHAGGQGTNNMPNPSFRCFTSAMRS